MSNLIALKDNNNDIGLGTSLINLGTISSTSILPFKKNDDTILLDFNTIDNSIHLGTISSGTWQGNSIDTIYGGTGLVNIGNAEQVLAVKNNTGDLEWINLSSNESAESSTNISTSSTDLIGIGSMNHKVTINASKLNINIGSNTPGNNNILQYNNNKIDWQNNSVTSIEDLFTLINLFHPAYIMLLKSVDVKVNSVSQTLVPAFDIGITNYSINIGSNYTVSILPTLFSSSVTTKINDLVINIPNTSTNNLEYHATPNIFTITNNYGNLLKTYTLNISRSILNDADLKDITMTTNPNITFNSFSSSTTSYNIDVLSNLTSFIITTQIHNTASYISISNTQNNNNDTSLNINSTTGNVDASNDLESIIINKTITPIYIFIKAEDTSINKEYIFNVSRPPRSTNDIEKIEVLDNNNNLIDSAIITFATVTTIETANSDDIFKFKITKNHQQQVININKILDDNSSQLVQELDSLDEIVTSININNKSQSDVTSGGSEGASQTYSLVITPPDTSLSKNTINVIIKRIPSTYTDLSFIGVDSSNETDNTISSFSLSGNFFINSNIFNISSDSITIYIKQNADVYGQSVKIGLDSNYSTSTPIDLNKDETKSKTVTDLSTGTNIIVIEVIAQDNTASKIYKFTNINVLQTGNYLQSIKTRKIPGDQTEIQQPVNNFNINGGDINIFTLDYSEIRIHDELEIICSLSTDTNTNSNLASKIEFSIYPINSVVFTPNEFTSSTNNNIPESVSTTLTDLGVEGIGLTSYIVTITVTSQSGQTRDYKLEVEQKNTVSGLEYILIEDTANDFTNNAQSNSNNFTLSKSTYASSVNIKVNAYSLPVTLKYSTDANYGNDTEFNNLTSVPVNLNYGSNNLYIYSIAEAGNIPTSGQITANTDNTLFRSAYSREIQRYNNNGIFTVNFVNGTLSGNSLTVNEDLIKLKIIPESSASQIYTYYETSTTNTTSNLQFDFSNPNFFKKLDNTTVHKVENVVSGVSASSTNSVTQFEDIKIDDSITSNNTTYYLKMYSRSEANKFLNNNDYDNSTYETSTYTVNKIIPKYRYLVVHYNLFGSTLNYVSWLGGGRFYGFGWSGGPNYDSSLTYSAITASKHNVVVSGTGNWRWNVMRLNDDYINIEYDDRNGTYSNTVNNINDPRFFTADYDGINQEDAALKTALYLHEDKFFDASYYGVQHNTTGKWNGGGNYNGGECRGNSYSSGTFGTITPNISHRGGYGTGNRAHSVILTRADGVKKRFSYFRWQGGPSGNGYAGLTLPKGTFEALRTNVPTGNNAKKHYNWNNGITDSRYFDYHADKPEDRKYLNFAGLDWEIFLSNANPYTNTVYESVSGPGQSFDVTQHKYGSSLSGYTQHFYGVSPSGFVFQYDTP